MSLHPIQTLEEAISEYRDYISSEFRAKDPQLRGALEAELDRPLFLTQEPFYQAHRPFKPGTKWTSLPITPALGRAMETRTTLEHAYLHQSDAIEHLLGPNASSLVVTTGTGSGKSECFLLPAIENAIQDAARFQKRGLTAILIYPMNALANDQLIRIQEYLKEAGADGKVVVQKYDRGTSEEDRRKMRENPPHILLTNYMMLEYLLVRPNDRDSIFANHRCRFVVLDEVHTYRGVLGSNIALLLRRCLAHLGKAAQSWGSDIDDANRQYRYPKTLFVGTSATIKSVTAAATREERIALRDATVSDFFSKLTGVPRDTIKVLGEEVIDLTIPDDTLISPSISSIPSIDIQSEASLRQTLSQLTGLPDSTPLHEAASKCRLLWLLNHWLISAPQSISQIAAKVAAEVPERKNTPIADIKKEVEAALIVGAALPDNTPGALRLRTHRFLRGGWKFVRCIDPKCGRIYPMGEEKCQCGKITASLFLCRSCGADYLRLRGNPDTEPLQSDAENTTGQEWMVYDEARLQQLITAIDDDEPDEDDAPPPARGQRITQVGGRQVKEGSLNISTLQFSSVPTDYPFRVKLVPAKSRCLCCGGTAGSRSILTPVSLGTSAAVKVISEGLVESLAIANAQKPNHDGKERLLIFSDSRQDASHQARFIIFAGRYDRMRRRLVQLLEQNTALSIQRTVELLAELAVSEKDNPHVPQGTNFRLTAEEQQRIRAWEEAPLLDEIAVTSAFRGTALNLGLVAVDYDGLEEHVRNYAKQFLTSWHISEKQFVYLCRAFLETCRLQSILSREMLQYHPSNIACPEYVKAAGWERKIKGPRAIAAKDGHPAAFIDLDTVPHGIQVQNVWKRQGVGGRGPRFQRVLQHLMNRFGGKELDAADAEALVTFLQGGRYLVLANLAGTNKKGSYLQLNHEALRLYMPQEAQRFRCNVCSTPLSGAYLNAPCHKCHGQAEKWPDREVDSHRTVKRLRSIKFLPLFAQEHTAQVPTLKRVQIEEDFKADKDTSPLNILACSPTMEMGIDVGGLDAVVMRNIPPRPDNYAQRGGRAGRRTRVGLVVSYAKSTPHDQYFYDHPEEMISGEIPAPSLSLGNRDVLLRHINAIAFGSAQPGLAGKMVEYVDTQGQIKRDKVDELKAAVAAQTNHTIELAQRAWGEEILNQAGLSEEKLREHLSGLPDRIEDLMARTCLQVQELRQALDRYAMSLLGRQPGTRAGDLVARLLGVPLNDRRNRNEADDSSAGYPLRRFAEFGILPGYEFPAEPATLRLLGDQNEEDPITANRIVGISQFMPAAAAYARNKRWKVIGLDNSSPWNPRTDVPWAYRICSRCDSRYEADHPTCPRCGNTEVGRTLPGFEFGGFLAVPEERPVLDEEDRIAARNRVECHPQWDTPAVERWSVGPGWRLTVRKEEEVRWINEGLTPTSSEIQNNEVLHPEAKGFALCPTCGRSLEFPQQDTGTGTRRQPRRNTRAEQDPYGHAPQCAQIGQPPRAAAIVTCQRSEVLRLEAWLPGSMADEDACIWGHSLGNALFRGICRHFLLDGREIEFVLEGPWEESHQMGAFKRISLSFIDKSIGGSGYLPRIAREFNQVAQRALEHLVHPNCQTACYRCLKSFDNQRQHQFLEWPRILPDLQQLAQTAPQQVALDVTDGDDPGPWLEAFSAGVGSPLELKFLRLFEKYGFSPHKQVPVAPSDSDLPISVADFAIPLKRVAIYVDGASFHLGAQARRDKIIRDRLQQGPNPWKIVVLSAQDLSRGESLVREITAM